MEFKILHEVNYKDNRKTNFCTMGKQTSKTFEILKSLEGHFWHLVTNT